MQLEPLKAQSEKAKKYLEFKDELKGVEVAVWLDTLDNTDRALAYDADEVMITRRYYRSGDGEYYINKQSARLRDINELFMDTGLGREGYSNIGQGRIDAIN